MQANATATWEDYLLLTLSIEAAAAANNWFEFQQLAIARHARLQELRSMGTGPDPEEALQIEQSEQRTLSFMSNRKRAIAQELSKISKFNKASQARVIAE